MWVGQKKRSTLGSASLLRAGGGIRTQRAAIEHHTSDFFSNKSGLEAEKHQPCALTPVDNHIFLFIICSPFILKTLVIKLNVPKNPITTDQKVGNPTIEKIFDRTPILNDKKYSMATIAQ